MTYTPEHLQALREALASGEHRVTYEGKSIEYRSVADLKAAIAERSKPPWLVNPAHPNRARSVSPRARHSDGLAQKSASPHVRWHAGL